MSTGAAKRFWWVNQNQTFDQERAGGYLWSPKRNKNDARNQFYENMRLVAPGDIVFSFCDKGIAAIGVARSYGYESPKPAEFGTTGPNWSTIGWRVDVEYTTPASIVEPSKHMALLGPLLPTTYSPLQPSGKGLQSVYLAAISEEFAEVLAGIVGPDVQVLTRAEAVATRLATAAKGIDEWEEHLRDEIAADTAIPETERKTLIKARRGQGKFKENVMRVEAACRITRVDNPVHLIGSHIKPWRDSNNSERLNGENGLLLTPSVDHLFDRGFISFEDTGDLLISPRADRISLARMGMVVDRVFNVGVFSRQQKAFLDFHRESVFLDERKAR